MTTNDKNIEAYFNVEKKLDESLSQFSCRDKKKLMDDIRNILQPEDYTITSADLKKRNCESFWKDVQRQIYESIKSEITIYHCSSIQYHYIKPLLNEKGFYCKYNAEYNMENLYIRLYDDSPSDDDHHE